MTDLHPPLGFDPLELAPPPLNRGEVDTVSLALDLSGTCNLGCGYCAEAATQPPRAPMSPETLEAAWRILLPRIQAGERTSIHLGSGEPLLAFPLLLRLANLIERASEPAASRKPDVFLTTNGTLLSRQVRDWLVASGWQVRISLDGPRAIHDSWRVLPGGQGTFDAVAEAVQNLAGRMDSRLSVTAVLCRGADPGAVFDAIADLGVRSIELVPVAHRDSAVRTGPEDIEAYRRFVRRFAQRFGKDDVGQDVPSLTRFEAKVVRAMGYAVRGVSCGAGRSYLGVAPDGGLYPCFRFFGLRDYRLGSLQAGLDMERTNSFHDGAGRAYDQRQDCGACWAAPLCGGPCFANAELFGPGDGQPLALHCAYVRAEAWAAANLVTRLRRDAPQRLMAFLPKLGMLEDLP